jgi:1-acyl-sn-glycerol-3-phosphate acyltransferase
LDPVLIGLACDRRLNYLARQGLFRVPVLGALIRYYDAIPIDREATGIGGLKETLRRLRRGEMVLIFPEGTRTPDGSLLPLLPGVYAVAHRSRSWLLPVAVAGGFEAWPRHRHLPRPAPIAIQFGAPIPPDVVQSMSQDELLSELQRRIADCWQRAEQLRQIAP